MNFFTDNNFKNIKEYGGFREGIMDLLFVNNSIVKDTKDIKMIVDRMNKLKI